MLPVSPAQMAATGMFDFGALAAGVDAQRAKEAQTPRLTRPKGKGYGTRHRAASFLSLPACGA